MDRVKPYRQGRQFRGDSRGSHYVYVEESTSCCALSGTNISHHFQRPNDRLRLRGRRPTPISVDRGKHPCRVDSVRHHFQRTGRPHIQLPVEARFIPYFGGNSLQLRHCDGRHRGVDFRRCHGRSNRLRTGHCVQRRHHAEWSIRGHWPTGDFQGCGWGWTIPCRPICRRVDERL